MPFDGSVVVGDDFQGLLDFGCEFGTELDVFVNKGELAVFVLSLEDKEGVVFEQTLILIGYFPRIFGYFLEIVLMLIEELDGSLVAIAV